MLLAGRAMLVAAATAVAILGPAAPASAFGVAPPGADEAACDPGQMPCTGGGSAAAAALLLATGVAVRRRD